MAVICNLNFQLLLSLMQAKVPGTVSIIFWVGMLGTYVTCILQPLVDYMYLLHTVTVSDGRIESR